MPAFFAKALADRSAGLRIADGAYQVQGGKAGVFIVADPSRNAMPMLRTSFKVQNKPLKSARVYATARGTYELYLNGHRLGDDYYEPGFTQYNRTHAVSNLRRYETDSCRRKCDGRHVGRRLVEWSASVMAPPGIILAIDNRCLPN